jgi:beta-phosphoglucomutase
MIAALVLDFDGVVADTEPVHLAAFRAVLAGIGLALEDDDYYARYLGYDDRAVLRAVTADRGLSLDDERIEALVNEKAVRFGAKLRAADVLFPGAAEAIRRFAAELPVAIASGALRSEIEMVLGAAGLRPSIRAIVAAGETPAGKPAPDPFAKAVSLLGVEAARAVAVEDSVWGVASAKAAGLKVVAVTTSYPAGAFPGAALVVPSLAALTLDALRGLDARGGPSQT